MKLAAAADDFQDALADLQAEVKAGQTPDVAAREIGEFYRVSPARLLASYYATETAIQRADTDAAAQRRQAAYRAQIAVENARAARRASPQTDPLLALLRITLDRVAR